MENYRPLGPGGPEWHLFLLWQVQDAAWFVERPSPPGAMGRFAGAGALNIICDTRKEKNYLTVSET